MAHRQEPGEQAPEVLSQATIAAQAGRGTQYSASMPLIEPIYQSAVFEFPDMATGVAIQSGDTPGYTYARGRHPNGTTLEQTLAMLEGTEDALACSSGMSASLVTFLATLQAGDHVVAPIDLYGGTHGLLAIDLGRFGVTSTFVDVADVARVVAALRPETRMIYAETVGNPTMSVPDIAALATVAHQWGAVLVVDNTFATPCLCRPVELGADYVVHSVTKFIAGHNDLIAGLVAGRSTSIQAVREVAIRSGCILASFDAWLALRGAKTLPLRMQRSSETALTVARFLAEQPQVRRVLYPGLESHPHHDIARRQFKGSFGAMLSFDVEGGGAGAAAVLGALELLPFAPSLGGVGSSVSHPATTSHRGLSAEERHEAGISDGMIRLSIGLEEPADVIADLRHGLQALKSITRGTAGQAETHPG